MANSQEVSVTNIPKEAENNGDVNIYNTDGVDIKPVFPGGIEEFYKFIGANYNTPNVKGLSGQVSVTFVIEKAGRIV